jgi:hypothetical protein
MSVGAKMFRSYADRYADWEARGKPPSPSTPVYWVWRGGQSPVLHRITKAQGGACSLCGEPLRLDAEVSFARQATIDHVVPRFLGGDNNGNRLVAHRACNSRKSATPPTGCEIVLLAAVNARLAQRIEAGTDETLQAAQPEGREPGPKDAPKPSRDTRKEGP